MSIEISEYNEFEAKINEVREACNFIPDASTAEGYEKSKRISLDVGKVLTALDKARKEQKSSVLERGRLIDSEAKRIVIELEEYQLPHKSAYKELDKLKKEREEKRKSDLDGRVRAILELPELMQDSDSEGVKLAIEGLEAEDCESFYEFTAAALKARNDSKKNLSKMLADKLKQEKEAVELAELRAKQAIQDQKDHDERIAKEASAKAEQETVKAKEAEQKAIDQAAEAVRQREAAEEQAEKDKLLAEERRVEAEKEAKKGALKAAQDAKLQAIAEQEEKERDEAAEIAKREANKNHVSSIRREAKDSLIAIGVDEVIAKTIVLAISSGAIKNVSIKY